MSMTGMSKIGGMSATSPGDVPSIRAITPSPNNGMVPQLPVTSSSDMPIIRSITPSPNNGMAPQISPTSSGGVQTSRPITLPPNNGMAPQLPPGGENTSTFNVSAFVPICKQDQIGKFIQYNNPQYESIEAVDVKSETATFEATNKAVEIATASSDGIRDILPTLASIDTKALTTIFKNTMNAIGGAAGLLSVGLNLLGPIFGIGGDSVEDAILSAVNDGFRMINDQLDEIEIQIRKGFLEIAVLIGDVELDTLTASLSGIRRRYDDYVLASNKTRFLYDASFRAYCNEPFHTPQDIFFNLYGYACSNCSFAPGKRVNLTDISTRDNRISQSEFRRRFGNFILQSMLNAMFLHSICLPPIEGSCVDRSNDIVWQNGIQTMLAAFNETADVIDAGAASVSDWVNLIGTNDLLIFFPEGVDNLAAANAVLSFLSATQPEYHIQVIVSDSGSDFFRDNIWRSGCDKNTGPCTTNTANTGHFWIDIRGKALSVRYRLKTIPLRDPLLFRVVGGEVLDFPEFYVTIANRLTVQQSLALSRTDGNDCPTDIVQVDLDKDFSRLRIFPACLVDLCFECDTSEQEFFNLNLDAQGQSYYIFRLGFNNVQEVSNNVATFPRFNPSLGENFVADRQPNIFTFFY